MPDPQCSSLFTTSLGHTFSRVVTFLHLQIVLEHKVGVANGHSPFVMNLWLLSHPCEPVGWCDFEEDFCSYDDNDSGWSRYSAGFLYDRPSGWVNYPYVDHTYGVPEGKWHAL